MACVEMKSSYPYTIHARCDVLGCLRYATLSVTLFLVRSVFVRFYVSESLAHTYCCHIWFTHLRLLCRRFSTDEIVMCFWCTSKCRFAYTNTKTHSYTCTHASHPFLLPEHFRKIYFVYPQRIVRFYANIDKNLRRFRIKTIRRIINFNPSI